MLLFVPELCHGWEIVCPDGKVRHYPYHNEGDAECDAAVFTESVCDDLDAVFAALGPCPNGTHTHRAVSFTHPSDPGPAAA